MMYNDRVRLRQPVLTFGCLAADFLKEPKNGHIEAVFDTTFYIEIEGFLICLGRIDMKPGPINCITHTSRTVNWRENGLKREAPVTISSTMINVDDQFRFQRNGSNTWNPQAIDKTILEKNVTNGIAAFKRGIADRNDNIDGLGRFLVSGFKVRPNDHLCQAAYKPMKETVAWLYNAFQSTSFNPTEDLTWIRKLSGLGPGLTPSGDDFLGGIMIALHSLDKSSLNLKLWPTIRHYVEKNSNPISLAHLSAASQGLGSAGIHQALAAILYGNADAVKAALNEVALIGHSSGWDIMTGIVVTIQSWLKSRAKGPQTVSGYF